MMTTLPGTALDGKYFVPTGWSPDGKRLAGILNAASGRPSGVATYDLGAQTTMNSADETFGRGFWWTAAASCRHKKRRSARRHRRRHPRAHRRRVRLPGPATTDVFAASPDKRTIYYGATRAETDIWTVERT